MTFLSFLLVALSPLAAPPTQVGPWDVPTLQAVKVTPTWGATLGATREVYYPGELFGGKPTRVFAYYARPTGEGPFPAVVLVHGGGGKAFRAWAEHWANRGYCALAMDLAGHGPAGRLPDGGPDQSDATKFSDRPATEMWTYHAIAAVIRGHNLIRSLPDVDPDRIAVTGISWGGYLTCIVAGLDGRFRAAVPVYGCGFLQDNSVWKTNRLDPMPIIQRERWVRAFDPSSHLPSVRCPILFLNGTNDFAYPLDSYQKCFDLVPSDKTLAVRVRLPHGHIWTFPEVDAFIDTNCKGLDPLPKLGEINRIGSSVSTALKIKGSPKTVKLHWATATGPWQKRDWKSVDARWDDGRIVANLPEVRPVVYYLSVVDDRGLEVSTRHEIITRD
ncbi:MAG: alpha/beta fold hydrolase [Planctomycetia bacterium]|nr:alpha/beta fold hydrolase [Planctomycetia bacterium]